MFIRCDDVLIRPVSDIHSPVLFVGEHRVQLRFLFGGEQTHPGQQYRTHPVQRVT